MVVNSGGGGAAGQQFSKTYMCVRACVYLWKVLPHCPAAPLL